MRSSARWRPQMQPNLTAALWLPQLPGWSSKPSHFPSSDCLSALIIFPELVLSGGFVHVGSFRALCLHACAGARSCTVSIMPQPPRRKQSCLLCARPCTMPRPGCKQSLHGATSWQVTSRQRPSAWGAWRERAPAALPRLRTGCCTSASGSGTPAPLTGACCRLWTSSWVRGL
jgi:hypothetical protein